jgi:hypothetical protein
MRTQFIYRPGTKNKLYGGSGMTRVRWQEGRRREGLRDGQR